MKKILLACFMLSACSFFEAPSESLPNPLPSETPELTPTPVPVLAPSPFMVPSVVPLGGPLTVFLCIPYKYDVSVFIDGKTLLGSMGRDSATGCMKLYYPALNQVGKRTIAAHGYSAVIDVYDFEIVIAK